MLVIPSIDLREGRVVRLLRGEYADETSYSHDPVAVVRSFIEQGATRVHVVDLDAARGEPDPASHEAMLAVLRALSSAGASVQVGGGVRGEAAARRWFELGAAYVVLGSLAITDPDAARLVCEAFPGRVLLGLDVRGGVARARGWTESGGTATEHLQRWSGWPSAGVVHTTIERDGTLSGPDITALGEVRNLWDGPLYSSGGIRDLDDVAAGAGAGAAGVIVGRALHDGLFDLREAVRRFHAEPVA
jgi:phosphoribosylformimino-5-aminoimidazole carboxamide ribotide isomerase